jgi:type IV secretory pathway protease TraF
MTPFGWVMLTTFAALGTAISAAFHPPPRLIWNASASVPIGLYAVRPAGGLHIAELVIVRPPIALATFMDQRRYLPIGVPMLKRVAAFQGKRSVASAAWSPSMAPASARRSTMTVAAGHCPPGRGASASASVRSS